MSRACRYAASTPSTVFARQPASLRSTTKREVVSEFRAGEAHPGGGTGRESARRGVGRLMSDSLDAFACSRCAFAGRRLDARLTQEMRRPLATWARRRITSPAVMGQRQRPDEFGCRPRRRISTQAPALCSRWRSLSQRSFARRSSPGFAHGRGSFRAGVGVGSPGGSGSAAGSGCGRGFRSAPAPAALTTR